MAEIKAEVQITGRDELSRKLEKIDKSMKGVSKSMEKSKKSTDKINKSLKTTEKTTSKLNATMKKTVGIFAAFFAIKAVKEFVEIGGAMSDITAAADEMLVRFDKTANTALPELRSATRGMVTDLNLLIQSNTILTSTLGNSLTSYTDVANLMDLVDRRATAMGVSYDKLIQEVLSAAKEGNTDTLRRLLNIETLVEAASLADALATGLTKINKPSKNAQDNIVSVGVAFSNLRTKLAKGLVDSPTFQKVVKSIEEAFNAKNIEKWASSIEGAFSKMSTFFKEHGKAVLALGAVTAGGVLTIKVGGALKTIGLLLASGSVGSLLKGVRTAGALGARGAREGFGISSAVNAPLGQKITAGAANVIARLGIAGKFLKGAGPLGVIIAVIEGIVAVVLIMKSVGDKLKARGTSLTQKAKETLVALKGFVSFILDKLLGPIIENFKNVFNALKATAFGQIIGTGLTVLMDKLTTNIKFLLELPKKLISWISDAVIWIMDQVEKLPGASEAIKEFRAGQIQKRLDTDANFRSGVALATAVKLGTLDRVKTTVALPPTSTPTRVVDEDEVVTRRFPRGNLITSGVTPAEAIAQIIQQSLNSRPSPGGFGTGLMTRFGGEPTGIGNIPAQLQAMSDLASGRRDLIQGQVDSLASSLDIGSTAAQLFAQALANGTEGLKQLGPLIAGAFASTGAGLIGEGVSVGTQSLRNSLATGALSALGTGGASLLLGGAFTLAGSLLGSLFNKKEEEEVIENLEVIARNTDRSNELLSTLIGAPSDFISPNLSQLSFQGVSQTTFNDLSR